MDHLKNFKKLDLKTKKMISSNLSWNFKSVFKWKWLEFDEFKEYEDGEDSKYIDWLVSARENRLLTKKFSVDKSLKVFFVMDIWKSMDFGFDKTKKDTLLEIFFLLALSSVENWDDVGALIFDENSYKFFDTKKGKWHIFEIYRSIVEKENGFSAFSSVIPAEAGIYKNDNKSILNNEANANNNLIDSGLNPEWRSLKNLNSTFSFLTKIKLKNTLLFFLTDKMEFENDMNLKVLALKNDVIFVNVFDNFENTLDAENEKSGVLWFLSNLWKWMFVDNLDEEKKEQYAILRKSKIKSFSRYLHSIKVRYISIDNLTNIYKDFFNFFSK